MHEPANRYAEGWKHGQIPNPTALAAPAIHGLPLPFASDSVSRDRSFQQ
jgi:hypothetical protein